MPGRPRPLSPRLLRLAAQQEGLLSVRQCIGSGMSHEQIAARVRSKDWERPARGVVDTGHPATRDRADDPIEHRRRRAAVLGLLAHPGSVATGVCALVLHGVQGAPIEVSPEVAMPTGAPRAARPPVRLRRSPVPSSVDVDGFRCVPVEVALAQAVPELRRRPAVALMDSALHRGLLTPSGLVAAHRAAAGRRGVARTRSWWGLADGRAESPAETWARLDCLDAGFPPDALQLAVAGAAGDVFARVDLAWRLPGGTALLVEIDGRDVHSAPEAVYRDRVRQNRIDTSRTVVRRFTGADAWHGRVGAEVARVLRPAGWRPAPLPAGTVLRVDA
ncbi:type IV toxin-antitoxin system AbiEi family antitoxin domain-containing protein [Isoptericola sp. AK164]|uniref:type IV toxin-antitoxin system AbiEi family antitoxin domain-containing protein n=1 Tax=Isoptericola sp. AK164 TaxID=3024246 RepID=UPI002418A715|nr:type IV toxin-antitoxin system AbiEi family antitoxin domain-containing protein [Isoptericola sp. AK164]